MKKTYIAPETQVSELAIQSLLTSSLTVGDDLTDGTYQGNAKQGIWENDAEE